MPQGTTIRRLEKSLKGMIGFAATFHSFNKETTHATVPAMMRLITEAEDQGYVTYPSSSARRTIEALPKIRMLLVQSNNLSPANRGVQDLRTFKKKSQTTNPIAPTGTAMVFSSMANGKPKAHLRLSVDLKSTISNCMC